jgi:hypothetical protein
MSFHMPEAMSKPTERQPVPNRRQRGEHLILNELNPDVVVDQLDGAGERLNLVTFGDVRETCPKCQNHELKLILRQAQVRIAHLFCADCKSCFDAHYPNGTPALTI